MGKIKNQVYIKPTVSGGNPSLKTLTDEYTVDVEKRFTYR